MPEITIAISGDEHYAEQLRIALQACIDDGNVYVEDENGEEVDSIDYKDGADNQLIFVITPRESEDE